MSGDPMEWVRRSGEEMAAILLLGSLLASPHAEGREWPAPEVGGTLTPQMLARAMEEARRPMRPRPPEVPALPPDPFCPAALFAPDESVKVAFRNELILNAIPVHPSQAPYFDPSQGPAPLRCALEPHPEGTWHHDGKGTWFR